MGRLIAHRLLATIPVLLLVTAGVFALLHLTPGDPIDAMMAESVDAIAKEALRRELGLDRPISGYVDPLEEGWAGVRSLVLPAVTLGLALAAVVTRTLRSSLLDALAEDYVRTARAKGLAESHVIRRHVLKNALIPVVTVLGLQLGTLIGGAVITEYVFALPGVGRLVVDAVFARDYPLVQGVILLIAVGFIASNLLVDVLYGWIDPRIRLR